MKKRVLILAAALLCLLSTGVLAAGGTSQKVDLWNGNASMPTSIVSQDGEQYYEISSCSELAYVAQMGGSWLKQNYRLVADLDLDGRSWTPIGTETSPYTGIFDGNGHCISGLHIATARSQSGLFGAVQNAEIFGLELKDASIQFSGNQEDLYAGLLAGMTDETVSIHDCKVAGSIAITTSSTDFLHVGGLIGSLSSEDFSIRDCRIDCDIEANGYYYVRAGGIYGFNVYADDAEICGVVTSGKLSTRCITIYNMAGGLIGELRSGVTVSECCSTMDVTVLSGNVQNAGGLVGEMGESSLINCFARGNISGGLTCTESDSNFGIDCGGLVGKTIYQSVITNCYATGNVSGQRAGGLIGQTYSFQSYGAPTITNSAGWGDVSSNQYAGGLIGYQKSTLDTVENCYRNRGATVSGSYRNSTGYSVQEEDLCIVDFVENTLFWDLDQVWELSPSVNDGYPSLRLFASDTHTEQLRINSITVRDTDGDTLEVIPEDVFLATVSITNLTAESDLLVLLAVYTEEGQYQGMLWVSVEDLTPGATIKVTVPVENPSGRITNLKAFVVNSFADPTPMGTVISFLP